MSRRIPPVSFVLILLIFFLPIFAIAQSETDPDFAPNRIIVKLKQPQTANALQALHSVVHFDKSTRLALIDAEVWHLRSQSTEQAIAALKDHPGIAYVEPDYIVRAVTPVQAEAASTVIPNDVEFSELWGLNNTGQNGGVPDADIDAPEAWSFTTGKPVVVGVIDSGIDWQHEDLAANIWVNPNEIPNNGIDDDGNGYVDDVRGWDFVEDDNDPMDEAGHGTHVAGTIAAVGNNKNGVAGVNWVAKVMILRFLGADGSGTTSGAIEAIEYAVKMGAHLTNNSWGGTQNSRALEEAIAAAGEAGQLFVAAAGNSGLNSDITPHYPASYDLDNILAVANSTRHDLLSPTSTYGAASVDLAAPGTAILSTLPDNNYGLFSGTSMASPHAAGVASLILSVDPSLQPLALKNQIMTSVDTLKALSGRVMTSGRLNAFKALSGVDPDSIAPAAVTDLRAGEPASNELMLRWTASGDDSTTGVASRYEIRYATTPIDADNFEQAALAPNPPAPQIAGSPESYLLRGLTHSTLYYAAMRVIDNVGNVSPVSNLAADTTLGPPNIFVNVESLEIELLTGARQSLPVIISNRGEGTLDYQIALADSEVTWLSAAPLNGRLFVGDSATSEFTFDAAALQAGLYRTRVIIENNDPDNASLQLPVLMKVTGAPDIFVKSDSLDFGEVLVGQQDSTTLIIENLGTDSLRISSVQAQPDEFVVTPASAMIAPGDSAHFTVRFVPQNEEAFSGVLTIESNDPDEQVTTIALAGRGVLPPELTVAPDSLAQTLLTGQTGQQTLTLANSGGSDLHYFIEITKGQASVARRQRTSIVPQFLPSSADIPPDAAPGNMPSGEAEIAAEPLPFRDSFESGDFSRWLIDDATGVRQVTQGTAAHGQHSFTYSNVVEGHFHGIHQEFDSSQPSYIGFYIRSGSTIQSDAYFLLTADGNIRNSVILFFARGNGFLFANGTTPGGDESFRYQANRWYKIEFKKLDWVQKSFDYYVDGVLIKAAVPFRNASFVDDADRVYLYNFNANARAWWDDVIIGDPGTLWLDAMPASGTLPPNAQADIEVTFDAGGLAENTYRADLEITSNDPAQPLVTVPVSLHVGNAPDLALSADSLNFGAVYAGVTATDSLHLANHGTDSLRVSDISADSPEFRIEPTNLVVPGGEERVVLIHLTAESNGEIAATLTIESNDPDEAQAHVSLHAQALVPPKIALSPDSLSQALFTGETASASLTVHNANTDGDTLRFDLIAIASTAAQSSSPQIDIETQKAWATSQAQAWQNAASAQVLLQPVLAANPQAAAVLPIVISDPEGDGATVDVLALRALSGRAFIDFQIDFATSIDPNNFGGAISLDLDQNPETGMPPSFGNPQQDIGAEYELFFFNLRTGLVQLMRGATLIANYPLQIDDKSLRFSVALADLDQDDGVLDLSGVLGPGAMPEDWFPDAGHGTISAGASWLDPVSLSAKVAGGEQFDIEFEFSATGLPGGLYTADIILSSNDPFTQTTTIPARLRVTGAADIAFSDSSLQFGEVFVGYAKDDSVAIRNAGTDSLLVTSITSDNAEFAFDASGFVLQAGEQKVLRVTFAPQSAGSRANTLTVHSSDPDEPMAEIGLQALALLPPEIEVAPAELRLLLSPGEVHRRSFSIGNSGAGVLHFSLRDEEQGGVSPTGDGALFYNVNSNVAQDTLYRSTLDGDNPQGLFLQSGLSGMVTDDGNGLIYWGSFVDGTLHASQFDGSAARMIVSGLSGPVEIDVDAENGKIYWADFVDNIIARANLDGSGFEVIAAGQTSQSSVATLADAIGGRQNRMAGPGVQVLGQPWGIALDHSNGKVYWTEMSSDRVARANLDGSAEETLFTAEDSLDAPRGIVVDAAAGKLFFVDSFNGKIKRATLDGSQLETIHSFDPRENALSLAADRSARKLYWTTNGTDHINRINYDGSGLETVVRTNVIGFIGPFGVAVSPKTGWLATEPARGTLLPGARIDIEVEIDATMLQEGEYAATIFVESNDPARPVFEVSLALRIGGTGVVISTPDTLHGLPGDSLDLPVSVAFADSLDAIAALGAALSAEGDFLHYLGSTPGPILSGQTFNVHAAAPDSVRMALLALNQQPLSQSGVLATLHFRVDSAATGGEYALMLSDLSASAPSGQAIAIAGETGKLLLQTHSIAGAAFYTMADGTGDANRPVADLQVALVASNGQRWGQVTGQTGLYLLSGLRPGDDYSIEIGRAKGGVASALTPTDAFLIVQAFLGNIEFSGAQKLAADADGNHAINPIDAGLVFNRFLGRIAQFPIDDWRAFPAEFQMDDSLDTWKKTPFAREHRAVHENLIDQNFSALAIGDVDLSWPNTAPTASALLAKSKTGGATTQLDLRLKTATLSPQMRETTLHIVADGPALTEGLYALGGELHFDGATLEIADVRWGKIVPAQGFNADFSTDSKNGMLRFGAFTTTNAKISEAGVLLEIDVRLRQAVAPDASGLPLHLKNVTAVQPDGLSADRHNGARQSRFALTLVTAHSGAIQIAAVPQEFALAPNFPNPFNPSTRIRYQLAEAAQVKLFVFDALGHRVRTLVDDPQGAGFYSLEWDGRDQAGRAVASGVYLLRLEASGTEKSFFKSQKMLLMK